MKRYEVVFEIHGRTYKSVCETILEAKLFVHNYFFVEMGTPFRMYDLELQCFFDLWDYNPIELEEVDWIKEGF